MNLAWTSSPVWLIINTLVATGYSLAMTTYTHAPTGWKVDPEVGHVFGVRRKWKGKRIGTVAKNGYLVSQTSGRDWLLHRVIWEAAHGPIPDGHEVNHLNGVKTDNRLINLECTTKGGNLRHAYQTGLRSRRNGAVGLHCESHHAAKLTHEQVAEIRHATGKTQQQLADQFGVSQQTIWRIRSGKGWLCVA